jgi:hypothetical protein
MSKNELIFYIVVFIFFLAIFFVSVEKPKNYFVLTVWTIWHWGGYMVLVYLDKRGKRR